MSGLEYIHSKNVIHCDLKLENICLHRDELHSDSAILKIIDFGLSLQSEQGQAIMSNKWGSKGYMAPEIVNSKEEVAKGGCGIVVTPAIDMWAFGILLYEMCVAYLPT